MRQEYEVAQNSVTAKTLVSAISHNAETQGYSESIRLKLIMPWNLSYKLTTDYNHINHIHISHMH